MKYIDAKTIITQNKNPKSWFGCKYNMNIYRGCTHGCIYCDSRSDCYQNNNFDEIMVKKNALLIIEKELKSKRNPDIVGTGSMSDPYNPLEKKYRLTRGALELINQCGFGINITTKSNIITRDIDILKRINEHSSVCVGITITTSNNSISKDIESGVASSTKRFEAIKDLSINGIYTGILMMPILPFILDSEENIFSIVKYASEAGAKFIYPSFGVTLRSGQREYFYKSLDKLYPGFTHKYRKTYGVSYSCISANHKKLWELFKEGCKEKGIHYKMGDIIEGARNNVKIKQLSFF